MTPLRRGFALALAAAALFGVTTPLIAAAGRGAGPWTTAAWLYAGAAVFAGAARGDVASLAGALRARWPRLITIAVVGGALAPAAYVAGLRAAGPLAASLALTMEAPFSALIAVAVFREQLGRRAGWAMAAIVAGACLLAFGRGGGAALNSGVLLAVLATALWAADNALSSGLAGLDARATAFWKSLLGFSLSFAIGLAAGEPMGAWTPALALVAIGSIGYGASLVFYLRAQQRFGVARTASVFAVAPFIGAAVSLAAGDRGPGWAGLAAFALMAAGVILHAAEEHAHRHRHEPADHEHPHRHDDFHHDHIHDPPVHGEHTHPHLHPALVHTHEHAPDADHRHDHTAAS